MVVAGQPSRNRPAGQVILAVLLASLPLLALLVLQQGRVIDAQKLLIRQLSNDSWQLNAIRVREVQDRAKQAAPPAANSPSDTQAPSGKQQSSAAPERKKHKHHEGKSTRPADPQEYPAARHLPVRRSI
jgi:hypothetical protein